MYSSGGSFDVPQGKVENLLQSIGQHKACGPDGLSARILKECSRELATPHQHLLQALLSSGCFP